MGSSAGTEDGRRPNKAPYGLIATPTHLASYPQGDSILFSGSATDREDGVLSGASILWRSDLDGQIGVGTSFVRHDLSVGQHTISMISVDSKGASFKHSQILFVVAPVNQPPVTSIASPDPGVSVLEGAQVQFTGTATDPESGPLADSALVWTSSRDGEIGRGKSFTRSLTAGAHTLTLTAHDSLGAAATTQQTLTVAAVANQPPFGLITAPVHLASFTLGANVAFSGSATDPEDGALTGASLVWRSDRDGQIGTGTSFTKNNLSLGEHVITFISTDSNGLSFSHNRVITINAPAPAPATALSIATQPSATVTTGLVLAVQPAIQLRDASGAVVNQSGVVVAASIASGIGVLVGSTTSTTNASGVATFSGLAIVGVGSSTIRFTTSGLTPVTSSVINVVAAVATQLALTVQPSASVTSGVVFAQQPSVQLRNSNGQVSQSGVPVTALIISGGGTLGGATTVTTNSSGVATFSNLSISGTAGARTLQFAATGLTSATSNAVNVASGTSPSGSEPMFDQAAATILQDNMDLYLSVSAMLGTVTSSIPGFHPGSDPRGELGLTVGRGGLGKALRISYVGGTQTGSTWETHGTPVQSNSATQVIQYYARVNFSSPLTGTLGVKWLMGWHNSGNDRIQWHMHWANGSCPTQPTRNTVWQVMDQGRFSSCQAAQPVGPYIQNVADNQWHRFTYEYKPNSAAGARDGIARMWIDGVKVLDVSSTACGTTPQGGEKSWCLVDDLDALAVNDGIRFLKVGGAQTTTTPPWTLDVDDLVWWRK